MSEHPFFSMAHRCRLILLVLLLAVPLPGLAAATPHRHTVTVEGHPLAVWSRTAIEPRAIMLLVHGRTWSTLPDFDLQVAGEQLSLMQGLVEMGISVYGVDLRGYGDTPRDASGWLTPNRAAADVAAVLAWLTDRHPRLAPVYLFGWSYGAMVSQLVAQNAPDRVQGLILFGYPVRPGIAINPPHAQPHSQSHPQPLRAPTSAEAARSDFLLPGSISETAIETFVSSALQHDPVRMDWRRLEQWQALDAARVIRPTLLLQAQHDPLALAAVHGDFFGHLGTRDKAWVIIPGGDHAAFMETPRPYFLSTIESFLFRGNP